MKEATCSCKIKGYQNKTTVEPASRLENTAIKTGVVRILDGIETLDTVSSGN